MLSGFGAADELRRHGIKVRADLPGVGANLSEHVRAGLQFATREPVSFLRELRADRVAFSLLRWWLFGTGAFATQISSCNVVIRTDPELRAARHPDHVQPGAHGREDLVAAAEPPPGAPAHRRTPCCCIRNRAAAWRCARRIRRAKPRIEFNCLAEPEDLVDAAARTARGAPHLRHARRRRT